MSRNRKIQKQSGFRIVMSRNNSSRKVKFGLAVALTTISQFGKSSCVLHNECGCILSEYSPYHCGTDGQLPLHLPCIPQSLRCNFSHFTISDHHADFSMHIISLLFQVTDRLMDNRWISMCKWCFCLDFLSGCNSHAKKDFQCTICRKMFPCKVQCIFNLRQDLIFTQNLRFQSSCQIKKMFYSLTVCS